MLIACCTNLDMLLGGLLMHAHPRNRMAFPVSVSDK